jgi:hypothetical protein
MTPSGTTQRVARLARRQHGNVSFSQLLEAGLEEDVIRTRREAGWLIPRHRGVYAVGHVPRSRESIWAAAVLALGPEALMSYEASGALWDLTGRRRVQTHLTIPPHLNRKRRDGIIVHRQKIPAAHRATHRGIPCTNLLRTLLDLGAIVSLKELGWAFEEAQVSHKLRPDVLGAEVLSRPGHRGSGKLKVVLADAVDPEGVRSILELRFLRMCAAHGLPRPLVNETIDVWTPDFLWPEQMVVVETDGVDFHKTAAKRRRDTTKDEYLTSLGFTVIRLRWADVVERPEITATRVRDALSGT